MRTFLTRTFPAVAIVIAAALAGFFAYRELIRPRALAAAVLTPAAPAASPVESPADSGRAREPGSADDTHPQQAIADTLPDTAFADARGVTRRLSDWKGHPLLVNFWAPWCAPCREEIPLLEQLSRQRAEEGLQVIGVAVDSRAAVLDYARRAGIRYPLLIGQRPGLETVQALGMEAVFPFSVFVDAQGSIVTVKIGKMSAGQANLILDRLDDLDRGRIDLDTARREIADGIRRLAVRDATGHPWQ